jgi:hypothetical protein
MVAGLARVLKVPKFGVDEVEFGHLFFFRKGRKCDIDNLLKSFLDGLERGGVFHNDNQVVAITALKVFYVKSHEDARIEFNIFKHLPDDSWRSVKHICHAHCPEHGHARKK